MKGLTKIALTAGLAALLITLFSFTGFAADKVGHYWVYGMSGVPEKGTFSSGEELNDIFDDYDDEDYDIYVELDADLNLGGTSGEPLVIDTDANVVLNLKGHTIKRSFSDKSKYYDEGYVMEISPGRDKCEYWIISDLQDDGSTTHPTEAPGVITGGQNEDEGGGIYFDGGGKVYLDNISVSGNKALEEGGGIYANDTDLYLYLQNGTEVSGNSAKSYGGGICLYWGELIINDDTVEICKNSACNRGGGVCISGGLFDAGMEMKGGKISDNTLTNSLENSCGQAWGGGIFSAGDLKITKAEISGNKAINSFPYNYDGSQVNGGGIYIRSGDVNEIFNAVIKNNSADSGGHGGGIFFSSGDEMNLKNTVVSGNSAGSGGGLYILDNTKIRETKITGNLSTDYYGGGGVYLKDKTAFIDTEITDNKASNSDAPGGGIYALAAVTAERCVISGNTAGFAGGVYMDSDYDFKAVDWCRVARNFKHNSAYSNLYLSEGRITTAYLDINELKDFSKTLIYVTSEQDDEVKQISLATDLLKDAETEADILDSVWYDDSTWAVDSSSKNSYLYASQAYNNECTVHFMKEVTSDTNGTLKATEVATYVYPRGTTIFKGTVWGVDISGVSYDPVYYDNPVNPSEQSATSVKIMDKSGGGSMLSDLHFKNIHRSSGGKANNTDNLVRIDEDWVINGDVYVFIRGRENISSMTVDVPEIVVGEALPTTAYIVKINGADISAPETKIPVKIAWKQGSAIAEPGTSYSARLTYTSDFAAKNIRDFRYYNLASNASWTATTGGKTISGTKVTSALSSYYLDFTITTDKLKLTDISWPDIVSNAAIGDSVPETGFPSQIPVTCTVKTAAGTETREVLAEAVVSYPADAGYIRSDKVAKNVKDGVEFFKDSCNYKFTCSIVVPDDVDATDYKSGKSLSKTYTVNVAGESLLTGGLPELEISVKADKTAGTLKYSFSHPDPEEAVVYNERHYEVGTSGGEFVAYQASNQYTIALDEAGIAASKAKHEKYSKIYCIEAQAIDNTAQGYGDNEPASVLCKWYYEVVFEPETYTLTVKYIADSSLFPGSTWTADTEASIYYSGEAVHLNPVPAKNGSALDKVRFLSWNTTTEGVLDSGAASKRALSFEMPDTNVTLTAKYAPEVTEINLTLDDEAQPKTVNASLTLSDGSTKTASSDVVWSETQEKNLAKITLKEQADKGIYFASDVKVKINNTAVDAVINYDSDQLGTLTAETGFYILDQTRVVKVPEYIAPSAIDLSYTGDSQKLLEDGQSADGVIMYCLGTEKEAPEINAPAAADEGTEAVSSYSPVVPEAEAVGKYYVWYYVRGDKDHKDSEPQMITASIGKAAQKAPQTAEVSSKLDNIVTLKTQTGYGKTLYGYTTRADEDPAAIMNWQTSPTFTSLLGDMDLYFYVKFAGDDTYAEAISGKPAVVSTSANSAEFVDVGRYDWFYEPVTWAAKTGLTQGLDKSHFGPLENTTRAQLITFIWRLAGCPVVNYEMKFTDVTEDWYKEAVRWAASLGITSGTSETTFSPDAEITREQLATFIYNYAKTKGEGFTGTWFFLLDYDDAGSISEWADEAMHWCVMNQIVKGVSDKSIAPQKTANRAEVVTMLYRYFELRDGNKPDETDEGDKADDADKGDKADEADNTDKGDKADEADNTDNGDKADEADETDKSGEVDEADDTDEEYLKEAYVILTA